MKKLERLARIDHITADGVFEMTLATEGEASDGHILSMEGGTIPERMPLLTSHFNDPSGQLGSITNPRKELKASPPRLRATGNIEMNGPLADARRDLAHMIAEGHVSAVSIKWDEVPGKSIRRVNLPSDHPHFVDAEEDKTEARWGTYFEEWVAREGSIVALAADQGALIARAEQTEGVVSSFWREFAAGAEVPVELTTTGAMPVADSDGVFRCVECDEAFDHGDRMIWNGEDATLRHSDCAPDGDGDDGLTDTLGTFRKAFDAAHAAGAQAADLLNSISPAISPAIGAESAEDLVQVTIGEQTVILPTSLADLLGDERDAAALDRTYVEAHPEPAPAPVVEADPPTPLTLDAAEFKAPPDIRAFGTWLEGQLQARDERLKRTLLSLLAQQTGKVENAGSEKDD